MFHTGYTTRVSRGVVPREYHHENTIGYHRGWRLGLSDSVSLDGIWVSCSNSGGVPMVVHMVAVGPLIICLCKLGISPVELCVHLSQGWVLMDPIPAGYHSIGYHRGNTMRWVLKT